MRSSMLRLATVVCAMLLVFAVGSPAAAQAVETTFGGPGWASPTSRAYPTNLSPANPAREIDPEGRGTIDINVANDGARGSEGTVTVTDILPPHVTATEAGDQRDRFGIVEPEFPFLVENYWQCTIAPGTEANSVVACHTSSELPSIGGGGGNSSHGNLGIAPPNLEVMIGIAVQVSEGAPEGAYANRVKIEGGGAPTAATADPITISSTPVAAGALPGWDAWFSNADGTTDTQAGSTPYAWSVNLDLPTTLKEGTPRNAGEVRNLEVDLPRGLIGNPTATPRCSRGKFAAEECPASSQVGILTSIFTETTPQNVRVYNLLPPPGVALELGANVQGLSVLFDAGVRTGEGYGAVTHVRNIPTINVIGSVLTLWGVPGDPSHNPWRNVLPGGCTTSEAEKGEGVCQNLGPRPELKSFLRLPTSCSGTQPSLVKAHTWEGVDGEAQFDSHDGEGNKAGFGGCQDNPFTPSITIAPESVATDSPTGLHVDLHIPQPESVAPVVSERTDTIGAQTGLAEADLKDAVVTLPQGVTVNPSSANGLAGCSAGQIGLTSSIGVKPSTYTPSAAQCPAAAKIGTVEIDTPLLDHPLKGAVYVAQPYENEFGSLLAIYIAVDDPPTGVVVKLAGHVEPDGQTGQLTTRFDENPQLPFEDFSLDFFGGPSAALRTPPTCGRYISNTEMIPWTSPEGATATPQSGFSVTSGPSGSACVNSEAEEPHNPAFEANTLTPFASAYSPFVVKVSRVDDTQYLKSINVALPPGMVGKIAGIPYCPVSALQAAEKKTGVAERQNPSCPGASEVGTVNVGAGAGSRPVYVQGHAYVAGPYKGAPLSLAVVTPAVAGPYDLGDVVVRTALYIDSKTAQIYAVSDPFPRILRGIPLDIRSVTVNLSRSNFTLNPTSCNAMSVGGEVGSALNQTANFSAPFQVGGCQGLPFGPSLSASTEGKTSKANGASLVVKLTQKPGEANLHRVDLQLPLALPSRLTTLQKACTAVQFNANPAGCPPESNVGTVTATTPLLSTPLMGPAYLVSHGGAAFPDVVFVLQANEQGGIIRIDLVGNTDIKKGITFSRFEAIPDAPVTSFEARFPEGPHSVLAANANLCMPTKTVTVRKRVAVRRHHHVVHVMRAVKQSVAAPLLMPTTMVGQNGAVVTQTNKIAVTGCAKAKLKVRQKVKRAPKHRRKK